MKKLFSTLLLATGLILGTASAKAQVDFGLTGGLNLNKISFNHVPSVSSDNRAGWFVGPKVEFQIPVIGIGLDVAALYSQRRINGYEEHSEDATSTSTSYKSIEIPVNLRYSFGFSSLAAIFVATGPQFGFNVGDKSWKWNDTSNWELKKSNVSWNIGAGVKLLKHLEAGIGYNFAISKFAKNKNAEGGDFKVGGWTLQVAYFF